MLDDVHMYVPGCSMCCQDNGSLWACYLCCRDLRDAAMDEASRTKSELRQLRQQHEELLLSSREAASRADVANSQLMGELKLKGFELTRLQVSGECHIKTLSEQPNNLHGG